MHNYTDSRGVLNVKKRFYRSHKIILQHSFICNSSPPPPTKKTWTLFYKTTASRKTPWTLLYKVDSSQATPENIKTQRFPHEHPQHLNRLPHQETPLPNTPQRLPFLPYLSETCPYANLNLHVKYNLFIGITLSLFSFR